MVRDHLMDRPLQGDTMAGKFEVYKDRAGKFRFRLKASNGQVVATGEAYETKAAAKKGCESVLRAATVRRSRKLNRRGQDPAETRRRI
jgi:uncharacterized protein